MVQKRTADDSAAMPSVFSLKIPGLPSGYKIFGLHSSLFSGLLLLETNLHVDGLVLRVWRFMNAYGPLHAAGN